MSLQLKRFFSPAGFRSWVARCSPRTLTVGDERPRLGQVVRSARCRGGDTTGLARWQDADETARRRIGPHVGLSPLELSAYIGGPQTVQGAVGDVTAALLSKPP